MPIIVIEQVAWSVGLSLREPYREFGSDRVTVCVYDSGGPSPGKHLLHIRGLFEANTVLCSMFIQHNTASSSCITLTGN